MQIDRLKPELPGTDNWKLLDKILKKLGVVLGILLALIVIFWGDSCQASEPLHGVVVSVHDGDTLKLETKSGPLKVRLAQIDAPELKQAYGIESREFLKSLLLDKDIDLYGDATDRYGRTVGTIVLDGLDVNRQMVIYGYAWAYTAYLSDHTLIDNQNKAKAFREGLWRDERPLAPWIFRKK